MIKSYQENRMKYIILSIDWEKDASSWRNRDVAVDYGGVIVTTDYLLNLFAKHDIRCNWFVESHRDCPQFDLITLFPDYVKRINSSPANEVGPHIHWAKEDRGKWIYPVRDSPWVAALLEYAISNLRLLDIKPPAFRGGAFLAVPSLPKILAKAGIFLDSSSFRKNTVKSWPRSKRDIFKSRWSYLRKTPEPYRCSELDILIGGNSLMEFPVSYDAFNLASNRFLKKKFLFELKYSDIKLFTLYFHSYQCTLVNSPPNEKAKIDYQGIEELINFLDFIKSSHPVTFVKMSEANKILSEMRGL